MGVLIGDGSLPGYGFEKIIEIYYKATLIHGLALTADYQHVENPAYNTSRGPIDFWGVRIHAEY
jgi:high affinity Mn2+ porin